MEKDLRVMKEKERKNYNRLTIRNTRKGVKEKQSTTLKSMIYSIKCVT
jgi:hypothetical protein